MISKLRRAPGVDLSGPTDSDALEPNRDDESLDDVHDERASTSVDERLSSIDDLAARLFGDLAIKDRVLLKVLYVERSILTDQEIEWLAAQRGVREATIREELSARADEVAGHRDAALQELETRHDRIRLLHARHNLVSGIVTALDGVPASPAKMGPEELGRIRTGDQIRDCGPEARAALLERLEERLRTEARLKDAAERRARDAVALHPDYEGVAIVVGSTTRGASDAERKTAANTVTQRIRRLRRALKKMRDIQ